MRALGKIARGLAWIVGGIAVLAIALVAALLLTIDRPGVREWLRPRVATLASELLDADVTLGGIVSVGLGGVELAGVRIAYQGEQVLAAPVLRAGFAARASWPLLVTIRAEVRDFELDLRRGADGEWNVAEMLAGDEESGSEGPPAWLGTVEVGLAGGAIEVAGLAAEPVRISGVALDGAVRFVGADAPIVAVDSLALRWGDGTEVRADGWLGLADEKPLAVSLRADPVPGSDVHRLLESWPVDRAATVSVQVTGSVAAPEAEVHVASQDARLDVWASAPEIAPGPEASDPATGPRRVEASWVVTGIEPQLLAASAPPGAVSGEGSVRTVVGGEGEGPIPAELEADARLWQSSVGEVRAEWLTAQVRRQAEKLVLAVQGAAPGGAWSVAASGTMDVAAPNATALDLDVAVDDPGAVLPEWRDRLPNTALRLTATARAERPLDDDRVVEAAADLSGSRLRGVAFDDARVDVRLDPALIDVQRLRLRAGRTDFTAAGWLGRDDRQQLAGSLAGAVDLALVPADGLRGLVDVGGSAWGTLQAVGASATLASRGALATPAGDGEMRVSVDARDLGAARPQAKLRATARLAPPESLRTALGEGPQQIDATVDWERKPAATPAASAPIDAARIAFVAKAPDGREQRVRLAVEQSGDTTRAVIDELALAPSQGPRWRLEQQAKLALGTTVVEVQDFSLRSSGGRIALAGQLDRAGRRASELSLALSNVDLALLCAVAGLVECGGDLDAKVTVAGTASRPAVTGRIALADVQVGGGSYGAVRVGLRTERDELIVDGRLDAPQAGTLRLDASLPLTPGWPLPAFAPQRPLSLRVHGSDLDVGALRAVAANAVTELRGRASVDASVSGTVAQPRVGGSVEVADLTIGLVATGATWRRGRIAIALDGRQIDLRELSLDGGALSGNGTVDLAGDGPPRLDLDIRLASLVVVDRPEATAEASGALRISGTAAEPAIDGRIVVDPATIRPSLVPGGAAPTLDPTITVVRSPGDAARLDATVPGTIADALEGVPGAAGGPPAAGPTAVDRLRLAIEVALGSRVYIRRTDADIPLQGSVYVTKAPGDAVRISGQVFATRGWYTFQGRRLEIEHAYVYFSGETPIDPYLDVRAAYRSPEYRITIGVQGTVQQPTLDLASQPPLDQSDILAVLLFGKPASQLTAGQGQGLQQQAIGILASYVAPELERSVVDTFGLTSLTFQMPTGTTAGTVGVGRYFGEDIFVSIAQDFGGPQGGTPRQLQGLVGSSVTIQYYLTPSFTLQGSASSQGESAVDVIWQRRY